MNMNMIYVRSSDINRNYAQLISLMSYPVYNSKSDHIIPEDKVKQHINGTREQDLVQEVARNREFKRALAWFIFRIRPSMFPASAPSPPRPFVALRALCTCYSIKIHVTLVSTRVRRTLHTY